MSNIILSGTNISFYWSICLCCIPYTIVYIFILQNIFLHVVQEIILNIWWVCCNLPLRSSPGGERPCLDSFPSIWNNSVGYHPRQLCVSVATLVWSNPLGLFHLKSRVCPSMESDQWLYISPCFFEDSFHPWPHSVHAYSWQILYWLFLGFVVVAGLLVCTKDSPVTKIVPLVLKFYSQLFLLSINYPAFSSV